MASLAATTHHSDIAGRVDAGMPPWVRAWLWSLAGLVIVTVMVGGATRLTGSGLSITEWRPITGALPPLSRTDWLSEFARYQASPQYQLLNQGMSLAAFKAIYWWEWSHRQLGRFIGLVFALGFAAGLATRAFPWRVGVRLAGVGLLLAIQGLVGWIMVASGLKLGMTAVEPVDLAAHLFLASLFLASVVATASAEEAIPATGGREWPARSLPPGATTTAWTLLSALLAQIALGALVAGSHAGLVYDTWPGMGGSIVPPLAELFAASPWWSNVFENVSLIQLDHRLAAYAVLALALWNAILWSKSGADTMLRRLAWALAGLIATQVAIGVGTLILAVPPQLALAHQFIAMLVLVAATRLAMLVRRRSAVPASPVIAACASPLRPMLRRDKP
jgi:heme a synthase